MIELNNTTLQTSMPSGDKVEIGDLDSKDFKPHLKLNRWDGECFIKVGLPVTEKSLPIVQGDKIIWEGLNRHILMYPFASKQFELGAYEYEVVLEKKPKSNKIVLDFNTQGLKFFYQPALTQQEIEGGCFRPDNIVGSYAVYHATKGGLVDNRGKDYKAGIAFHIPRPMIIDARGDWAWEEQYIDPISGKQIITIPQEFLEYAHYPIRHAVGDTFGYTTVGGSWSNVGANKMKGLLATPASAGTADNIRCWATSTSNVNVKMLLVQDSDDTIIENGITDPVLVLSSTYPTGDWFTATFGTDPSITAQAYWVSFIPEGTCFFKHNTGDFGDSMYDDVNSYATPEDPDITTSNFLFSLYCTYTPEAPPAGHPYISRVQGVQGMKSWGY